MMVQLRRSGAAAEVDHDLCISPAHTEQIHSVAHSGTTANAIFQHASDHAATGKGPTQATLWAAPSIGGAYVAVSYSGSLLRWVMDRLELLKDYMRSANPHHAYSSWMSTNLHGRFVIVASR